MNEGFLDRRSTRFPWWLAAISLGAAGLITLVFTHALAAYWSFYHLTTGGTGLGLLYIVLPGAFLLSALVTSAVTYRAFRRDRSPVRALARGTLTVTAVLTLLLAAEIWRTTDLRSGEGPMPATSCPTLPTTFELGSNNLHPARWPYN